MASWQMWRCSWQTLKAHEGDLQRQLLAGLSVRRMKEAHAAWLVPLTSTHGQEFGGGSAEDGCAGSSGG